MSLELILELIIVFLLLVGGYAGWQFLRVQRQQRADLAQVLNFSASLPSARSDQEIIQAFMQTASAILRASGASFVPFNEFVAIIPPLMHGSVPAEALVPWGARLQSPETRQICKACQQRHQDGQNCTLLNQTHTQLRGVHCHPLQRDGREIGIVNFYFEKYEHPNPEMLTLLSGLSAATVGALNATRTALPLLPVPALTAAEIPSQMSDLLEKVEYRATIDERVRLAREIHDGLAQTLAFLKIQSAQMQNYLEQGRIDRLTETLRANARTLNDAYLDARDAIDNLRRTPETQFGDWLKRLANDFQQSSGLQVQVRGELDGLNFPPVIQAQMIRIVQEALNNVRKHAVATSVAITFHRTEIDATLEVRDDGCGFAPEQVSPAARYGLMGMRERAEQIGAEFQIISQPGCGASVRVTFTLDQLETL
jgi:signal transduction histidine kinase